MEMWISKTSSVYGSAKCFTCVCVYDTLCLLAQGSTFLDSCDFEQENICGMIQGWEDKADWVRVSKAAGGPDTDYSNMGKCAGEDKGHW